MDTIIPGIYLFWGLGHRAPRGHDYLAPSGARITGDSTHGAPYARSRAILLYLATRAIETGPTFSGRIADIATMFQLPWPADNIEKHFLSVTHARLMCATDSCACAPVPCRSVHRVTSDVFFDCDTRLFRVTLADEFILTAHLGMRCPHQQVAALLRADQLAALDLLIWYRWQEHRRESANVNAIGERGPFRLIKSARSPTRKRDELVRLHDVVTSVWLDCPYRVSPDGNLITYHGHRRASSDIASGCLFDVIFEQPHDETPTWPEPGS